MNDSIIQSIIESGAVTENELLFALHKTGKVDVVKLIRETVENIKLRIAGITNAEAVTKLRETSIYLATMADIIEDIAEDEPETESVSTQTIHVVGGVA